MAKLKASTRSKMKSTSFALPGKKAYPINDLNHARAALSRVAANGTPAQKKQVRAAVTKKYPSLKKK